jgi:hypothetical protein
MYNTHVNSEKYIEGKGEKKRIAETRTKNGGRRTKKEGERKKKDRHSKHLLPTSITKSQKGQDKYTATHDVIS